MTEYLVIGLISALTGSLVGAFFILKDRLGR